MNRGQLVGGIVCIALAALLAVANFALPPEKLMFQVGGQNMPWLGPIILGGVGLVLVVTAGNRSRSRRR